MNTLLSAEGIDKRFGGVQALKEASFQLEAGEVHALLGENGAGKSTLGKILAGVAKADKGTIRFNGLPAEIRSPVDAQRLGISIIFQELDLFPNLSVGENIVIRNLHFRESWHVSQRRIREFCEPFLRQVGIDINVSRRLNELSIGQVQLVAIARALSMKSRVMIMDESTSSLAEDSVENLFAVIQKLSESGVSIIYVSHKLNEIFRVTRRITVLRDGQCAGTRITSETTAEEIISLMVGRKIAGRVKSPSHTRPETLLSVRGLKTAKIENVSFDLHQGEVLGVAGLMGAGRTEIGRALFGMDPILGGTIAIHDRTVSPASPGDAMRLGIGLVPEDRKNQGLMMQMSVSENSSMSSLAGVSTAGFIDGDREIARHQDIAATTHLKAASPRHVVSSLSGGNQQKVLLGRWLTVNPEILFLDDPTRGVDVGAKEDIYGLIEELARCGKGVLMVSTELQELLRCCDRILVMHEGRMTGIVDSKSATQEEIMGLATDSKGAHTGR